MFIFYFLFVLVVKTWRKYNAFFSGTNHVIQSNLLSKSTFNDQKRLVLYKEIVQGLLLGFMQSPMPQMFHFKWAPKATFHFATFYSVAKNTSVDLAVEELEDKVFWMMSLVFWVFRNVFQALKALRFVVPTDQQYLKTI